MLLVRRAFIGIARRYGNPVEADLADPIEEPGDPLGLGIVEQGGVDVDPEAAGFRLADRRDSTIVDPVQTYRSIACVLAVAVEVNRPRENGWGSN